MLAYVGQMLKDDMTVTILYRASSLPYNLLVDMVITFLFHLLLSSSSSFWLGNTRLVES